ncbi:MAG: protein translocase subunit SecDF [Flavobacteriales bacterium]|nr:protein translocase subunit SecDF [Flavobacteriales bacterium]
MQNRSALWIFTVLLAIACLWQLSFSYFTSRFESKANKEVANITDSVMAAAGNEKLDRDAVQLGNVNTYLREHADDVAYPLFDYTYNECKGREINQGLDLKGGMAVTLEVSIPEMVQNLSGNSADASFTAAIANAREAQKKSNEDFITLFDLEFKKVAPNGSLAAIFSSQDNSSMFERTFTNEQVITSLRKQAQDALNNTEQILRNRIDKFGVAQPSIQKQALSGRIQIELPGVKDKDRVRKLLQSTANLEFYETFNVTDLDPILGEANTKASSLLYPDFARRDSLRMDSIRGYIADIDTARKAFTADASLDSLRKSTLLDSLNTVDSTYRAGIQADSMSFRRDQDKRSPLFGPGRIMGNPYRTQSQKHVDVIGYCRVTDTARVNDLLRRTGIRSPDASYGLKLAWASKAERIDYNENPGDYLALRALKVPKDGKPRIDGAHITNADHDFDLKGDAEVTMRMDQEGALIWKQMTSENIGKNVAIVLDDNVQSSPTVIGEIPNGSSSISMGNGDRNKQIEEATDLANILKAGALPAPARIIDETVVGATLGKENVQKGLLSFVIALIAVMAYMALYYSTSGWFATVALLVNLFILIGSMASLGASFTLPGIAGIVLTMGMAVDANVLINERVREELRAGKMVKSAVDLGFKGALSAIIDSNITTFATGVILFIFGSGPIKGFATTLMIGILTSLFTAIFITRLLLERRLEKGKPVSFWASWSKNTFVGANYDFMGKRKMFYMISSVIIGIGLVSIVTQGFNLGVDFSGGRAYVVQFENEVTTEQVKTALEPQFIEDGRQYTANVKTFGSARKMKITTNYLVDDANRASDGTVDTKLKAGLAQFGSVEILESRKVDPTISDDIRRKAVVSVLAALVFMFLFIWFRFSSWQYGLGAMLSLLHDALFVLGLYSLLWKIMPFSLEIDEAFIAVILTVVGYSINDTVVVFDRIREYLVEHKHDSTIGVFNRAINATLGRTLNTAGTTLVVLLVIFLFGGDSIKGFVFGMFMGILIGTYSSIFVASTITVDLLKNKNPETVPMKGAVAA